LKYETVEETKRAMKVIANDLGVKCKFCHNLDNFADDANEHKKIARSMMEMTNGLNKDFFNWEKASQISCWTCHQGKEEPPEKK
ncbi:MAG: c-type cytochrome, partial [FCB group bacterium]|nr:c-type cytochrome [FCB group bacterium]